MTLLKYILALFSLTISACKNQSDVEIRNNNFSGITKRSFDHSLGTAVDSLFDSKGALKEVIDYYSDDPLVKKTTSYFLNGMQDSLMFNFYPNGKVKSKRFFLAGKECFERIDFDTAGAISMYVFLSSDHKKIYSRLYNSSGECVSTTGVPFFESYMLSNRDQIFAVDDTLTTFFYAPNPPDFDVKLFTVLNQEDVNNIFPLSNGFTYRVKIYP
jgi:hypothetical protein